MSFIVLQLTFGLGQSIVKISISNIIWRLNNHVIPIIVFKDSLVVYFDAITAWLVPIKGTLRPDRYFMPPDWIS